MAKVDVIYTGYANLMSDIRMRAKATCSLVRFSGKTLIFDTLGPWEEEELKASLQLHKIMPSDIDYLVCSHSHPDHVGNLNLFKKAKLHVVGISVYEGEEYHLDKFNESGSSEYVISDDKKINFTTYEGLQLDNHVAVVPTFGHTQECVSLIVKDGEKGTIVLAGDLFECKEDTTNEVLWTSNSHNIDLQRANRSYIYNKADYIVPGHGKMFKTSGKLK